MAQIGSCSAIRIGSASPQQVLDDQLVERLIVAVGDECLRSLLIAAADLLQRAEEGAAADREMVEPVCSSSTFPLTGGAPSLGCRP